MMALVTGGASCGKSAFAERLCMHLGDERIYLAAMQPFGAEGARRVARHRAMRAGKGFTTIECYEGFDRVLDDEAIDGATVLLECLGNVVANEMFSVEGVVCVSDALDAVDGIESNIEKVSKRSSHLVIVGNEVGSDGFDYPGETALYQRLLGTLSQRLAALSDLVVECSAGVPTVLSCSAEARSMAAVRAGLSDFAGEVEGR